MNSETTAVKGNKVNLCGTQINVGDKAPQVNLISATLEDIKVGGAADRVQLFIVVPSLDTDVCAKETREFNLMLSGLDIVDTTVISMDLPFASKRFCAIEGIDNVVAASDYVDKEFGKSYGVLMEDGPLKGMLARSVFVVNEEGIVTYKEIVADVTSEPDYDGALSAVKDARLG